MKVVPINEVELKCIKLFRVALSEPEPDDRLVAIAHVRHIIVSDRLETLPPDWQSQPANDELVHWVAATSATRQTAVEAFAETGRCYDTRRERKLNIAEEIGRHIWLSTTDGEFAGLHTSTGLLGRVSHMGRKEGISGARDEDTLRKLWKTYRGVAHLGMAIDFCEGAESIEANVLQVAEYFRILLSKACPRSTSKPYVDPSEQISFRYLSILSGPRFLDRGLPFGP